MDSRIKVNTVVQINENGQEGWVGCLVQVDEIKSWGIVGYVKIPAQGNAYIRLKENEIDFIGLAIMIPENES